MYSYGDMPAHDFLWRECEKSSEDVAARLAVIPLVQVFPAFRVSFFPFTYVAHHISLFCFEA